MRKFSQLIAPLLSLTVVLSVSGACTPDTDSPSPVRVKGSASSPSPDASNQAHSQILHIPIGEFFLGSEPGEPGRMPALEPSVEKRRLGPFRIDGDLVREPDGSPKWVSTYPEAETLCAAKQGRLCSEVEWERACRGPSSGRYPVGDAPCSPQAECRSSFDVLALTQTLEWTSSIFGKDNAHAGETVVRGSDNDVPADQRRCAARHFAASKAAEKEGVPREKIGFRCCYGAPNADALKEPSLEPAYRETDMPVDELRALLRRDPLTAPFSSEAKFWKADAAATVLSRGPGDTKGFVLTTSPVIWHPGPGSEFLVLVGHDSHRTAFVLVYYNTKGGKKLAGSFLMKNEVGPVALAFAPSIRPRIHFSSCWGCPGETGKVLFREPEEIVLLQP